MYQSPIEIIQGQIRMEQENNILRAVMEQEIHVDKHELLRALQYDRGQYEKGYSDAMASVVRCEDCRCWWRIGSGETGTCRHPRYPAPPEMRADEYCSRGTRKE